MYICKEKISEIIKESGIEAEFYEFRGQLTVIIKPEQILKFTSSLKDNPDTQFDMLLDITAIDRAKSNDRFEVVYILYSNKLKHRLRVKAILTDVHCPSLVSIWESANWYERETFDMYGIIFDGHPNLRRFYMPEDYNDPNSREPLYPLRKDFPLMGIPDSLPLPPYPEKYGENS